MNAWFQPTTREGVRFDLVAAFGELKLYGLDVNAPAQPSRPCYSMRLVRPFLRVLQRHPAIPEGMLDPLFALEADDRIPIETLHELLRGALVLTQDPYLGLKAGRELQIGEFGVLDYLTWSSPKLDDAIAIIVRYMQLVNDALTIRRESQGDFAIVRLESAVKLPASAEAFEVACFAVVLAMRFGSMEVPQHEVYFTHEAPLSVDEYELTFPRASLHFCQEFAGFRFPRWALDLELPSSDPHLHDVLLRHAETLLSGLPKVESFVARVREAVVGELRGGNPNAKHIARLVHVSTRTLARRLEEEGTNFRAVVDDLRRRMALSYAIDSDMQISEIALLLGFSNSSAFNHAFKRWTGEAPLDYRRARRG